MARARGVLAFLLKRERREQQLPRVLPSPAGMTSVTRGSPAVMVPVLSSTTMSVLPAASSEAAVLKRMPFFAPMPLPTMIGDRRGEAQRAGAAYHQHAYAPGEGVAEAVAQRQPDRRSHRRYRDDGRDEDAGDPVGHLGYGGLRGRGVGHHLYYLAQGGVLPDARGAAADKAALVYRGGGDAVALGLVHGYALAGQRALVHGALALNDHAVHGYALARADHKDVAGAHLLHRHLGLCAAAHDGGGLGASRIRPLSASVVRPLLRASSILPTVMSVSIMAAASK